MQQKAWDIIMGERSRRLCCGKDICVDAGPETLLPEKKVFFRDQECIDIYINKEVVV
jgi:hypothetical protein